jgi:hypothetical protein
MGRQTSVSLSESDEQNFFQFLNRTADVRLIRRSADDRNSFLIAEFPPRTSRETSFWLWNTNFPFTPELAESPTARQGDTTRALVLRNTAGAPLIEYSRDAYQNPERKIYGRVYWNTDFALYHGLGYDHIAFGRWFNRVIRWLRNNGHRVEISRGWSLYCLPGAWDMRCSSQLSNIG